VIFFCRQGIIFTNNVLTASFSSSLANLWDIQKDERSNDKEQRSTTHVTIKLAPT
jgi:hypothetical protein